MFQTMKQAIADTTTVEVVNFLKRKPDNSLPSDIIINLDNQQTNPEFINIETLQAQDSTQPIVDPKFTIYLFNEVEKQMLWNFIFNNNLDYSKWRKPSEQVSEFVLNSNI